MLFDRPTLAVNELLLIPVIDTFADKIVNLMTKGKVFIFDKSDSNHSSLSQSSFKVLVSKLYLVGINGCICLENCFIHMEGIAFKYEVYSKRTLISNNTKIVSKESTF